MEEHVKLGRKIQLWIKYRNFTGSTKSLPAKVVSLREKRRVIFWRRWSD